VVADIRLYTYIHKVSHEAACKNETWKCDGIRCDAQCEQWCSDDVKWSKWKCEKANYN